MKKGERKEAVIIKFKQLYLHNQSPSIRNKHLHRNSSLLYLYFRNISLSFWIILYICLIVCFKCLCYFIYFIESHASGFQGWTHSCAISRDLRKKNRDRKIQTSTFRICARRRVSLAPYSGAELINICINHAIEYLRNKRVLSLV